MKHLRRVSVVHERALRGSPRNSETGPNSADAKTDFLNAIFRAWSDFVFQKKNELSV